VSVPRRHTEYGQRRLHDVRSAVVAGDSAYNPMFISSRRVNTLKQGGLDAALTQFESLKPDCRCRGTRGPAAVRLDTPNIIEKAEIHSRFRPERGQYRPVELYNQMIRYIERVNPAVLWCGKSLKPASECGAPQRPCDPRDTL